MEWYFCLRCEFMELKFNFFFFEISCDVKYGINIFRLVCEKVVFFFCFIMKGGGEGGILSFVFICNYNFLIMNFFFYLIL